MTAIPLTAASVTVAAAPTTTIAATATTVAVTTAIASSLPSSQQRNNQLHDQFADLLQKYFQLPQPIRFMIAGALGNIIFFAIEKVMYNDILPLFTMDYDVIHDGKNDAAQKSFKILSYFLNEHMESTSFFISYLIQIMAQHLLNAVLVFGWETISTREKYLNTLIGVYSTYSTTLLGSTIFNVILIRIGIPKDIAFWGTLLASGILNYYLLSWLATRKQKSISVEMVSRGGGGLYGRTFQQLTEKEREYRIKSAMKSILCSILLEPKSEKEDELLQFIRSL